MDNKEAKYKPLKANVTVDLKLLFREQIKKQEEQKGANKK